jgi:signal transduction histidine kinase
MPRLPEFIRENIEAILMAWETFARNLPAGGSMNIAALRDHAAGMLDGIARDIETPKPREEPAEEAQGEAGDEASAAARSHGAARAERGFTVGEMVAEFRALRASVIRLWTAEQGEIGREDLDDTARFHEAIDQAIAQSITRYTRELGRSQDRFLAILGHDLRTPLSAISMSADFILEAGEVGEPAVDGLNAIVRSASRMDEMVDDLIDFARARFGQGIPIVRGRMDARQVVDEVVAEVAASYPKARVRVEATGRLHGDWDATRLAQALTNLVANSVQHGSGEGLITVAARGLADEVTLSVHNDGPAIPPEKLNQLFAVTGEDHRDRAAGDHLGLGLYIAGEIVEAHGGAIDVTSSAEEGTTFTAHLPRHQER